MKTIEKLNYIKKYIIDRTDVFKKFQNQFYKINTMKLFLTKDEGTYLELIDDIWVDGLEIKFTNKGAIIINYGVIDPLEVDINNILSKCLKEVITYYKKNNKNS